MYLAPQQNLYGNLFGYIFLFRYLTRNAYILPFLIWSTKNLHVGYVQIEKNKSKLTPFLLNAHSSMKNSEHMAGFYSALKKKICNFVVFSTSEI